MTSSQPSEPLTSFELGQSRVTILGTAHVSRASAQKVRELLATGEYDAVGVELCPSRYNAIVEPDAPHLASFAPSECRVRGRGKRSCFHLQSVTVHVVGIA